MGQSIKYLKNLEKIAPIITSIYAHVLFYTLVLHTHAGCAPLILLDVFHNTSRLTVSQFLLYLVFPPFNLRLGFTYLFPGHEHLWLGLELLLLWAHSTGTSYLSSFANIIWSVPQAPENLTICQWRHWPESGAPLIKWCYINVWLRLSYRMVYI